MVEFSQDQLFAYYLSRCGSYHVSKPNKEVLYLLENNLHNHDMLAESVENRNENEAELSSSWMPLAKRKRFKLFPLYHSTYNSRSESRNDKIINVNSHNTCYPIHIGARGMLALLDLIAILAELEEIDVSNCSSWYVGDAFAFARNSISGNNVFAKLCMILPILPKLRKINICGQPIGTFAADMLCHVIDNCPVLSEVEFDKSGVDTELVKRIEKKLKYKHDKLENQVIAADCTNITSKSTLLNVHYDFINDKYKNNNVDLDNKSYSNIIINNNNDHYKAKTENKIEEIRLSLIKTVLSLPFVDRKTTQEQHALRMLLLTISSFYSLLTESQIDALILHSSVISTHAASVLCGHSGLRGNGEYLFLIKDGAISVGGQTSSYILRRGDYFGDTYDSEIIYPAGQLIELERGNVYCLPLQYCTSLLLEWNRRVREYYYSFVRSIPLLQSVDCWTRVRVCTCAEEIVYNKRTVVITAEHACEERRNVTAEQLQIALKSKFSSSPWQIFSSLEKKYYYNIFNNEPCKYTASIAQFAEPKVIASWNLHTEETPIEASTEEALYFVRAGLFYATVHEESKLPVSTSPNAFQEQYHSKCETLHKFRKGKQSSYEQEKANRNKDADTSYKYCDGIIYKFKHGECFGEEFLVSEHKTSSVDIIAEPPSKEINNKMSGNNEMDCLNNINLPCICLKITGSAVRLLLAQLFPVFRACVDAYTLHDDLKNDMSILRAKKQSLKNNNKTMYFL